MTDAHTKALPSGHKLPGLELLRLAAAFAVVLWHYRHFSFDGSGFAMASAAQQSAMMRVASGQS